MMSKQRTNSGRTTRRRFLEQGVAGAGALLTAGALGCATPRRTVQRTRPNLLLIISDQLGLDALSGHGCVDVDTPNIDRLMARGVTFLESHSTDPVCSPARSSILTGRMPDETGVITNTRPIHPSVPDLGQWFRQGGYDTAYSGKWHLPYGYPVELDGFDVLPAGGGQGDLADTVVSRSCEAFLRNRTSSTPFLLVSSFMQPHDICYWAIRDKCLVPKDLPIPHLAGGLPELPPNHEARPRAPQKLDAIRYTRFNEEQWRYYLYIYYRQIEMLDADVGRVLDALEQSGLAENTVVGLTADHGDGRGRHGHVSKWYPYDESVKVPMVVSCPGRIDEGRQDARHLVSGLDVMSTFCDYAEIAPPPHVLGMSLRPLLEGKKPAWRDFVVAETHVIGRTVRTERYKYVKYADDPVEQLFDMQADPWETRNLYDDARLSDVVADHRKILADWEARLLPVEPTPTLE